jgi:hypothetical protein
MLGGDTSKRAAADALDAVLNAIAKGVKQGPVQFIGFGTFKPVDRKAAHGPQSKDQGAAIEDQGLKEPCASSPRPRSRARFDRRLPFSPALRLTERGA